MRQVRKDVPSEIGGKMQERNVQDDVTVDGVELTKDERQETEVWTRVMGYYRLVSQYNTGKQGEFHERVEFEEPKGGEAK